MYHRVNAVGTFLDELDDARQTVAYGRLLAERDLWRRQAFAARIVLAQLKRGTCWCEVVLRKACGCKNATASGPRMAYAQTYPTPGTLQITLKLVGFACDRCEQEWIREIQPEVP